MVVGGPLVMLLAVLPFIKITVDHTETAPGKKVNATQLGIFCSQSHSITKDQNNSILNITKKCKK
jgi:hypothetical protein